MAEEWKKCKPNDNREGVYFISNKGRVLSLYRPKKPLVLKPISNGKYL